MKPSTLLPPGVRPGEDRGVFHIESSSRKGLEHMVDVEMMICGCESFTKGKSHRERKDAGEMTWGNICRHLRKALAAHGVLRAMEDNRKYHREDAL